MNATHLNKSLNLIYTKECSSIKIIVDKKGVDSKEIIYVANRNLLPPH